MWFRTSYNKEEKTYIRSFGFYSGGPSTTGKPVIHSVLGARNTFQHHFVHYINFRCLKVWDKTATLTQRKVGKNENFE